METLPPELILSVIDQVSISSPITLFELLKVNRNFRLLLQFCQRQWKTAARKLISKDPRFHLQHHQFDYLFMLFTAINLSNYHAVQALVYAGVDVNTRLECYHYTPILLSVSMDDISSSKILLRADADITKVDAEGYTVMHKAASNCNMEMVRLLESYSAEVNVKAYSRMTPLHCAAKYGHLELCKYFASKIDVNEKTRSGKIALHFAAYRTPQSPEIVQFLIDAGSDPLCQDIHGFTALHVAAMHGNARTVNYLARYSIVNTQTKSGCTPLHLAVAQDHINVCQTLMDAGADPFIPNTNGETALDEITPENLNQELEDVLLPDYGFPTLWWTSLSLVLLGYQFVGI